MAPEGPETWLAGTGRCTVVSERLKGSSVSVVLWHPVHLQEKSLSSPPSAVLVLCDSESWGTFAVEESKDTETEEWSATSNFKNYLVLLLDLGESPVHFGGDTKLNLWNAQ